MMKSKRLIRSTAVMCLGVSIFMTAAPLAQAEVPQSFSNVDVVALSSQEKQSPFLADVSCGISNGGMAALTVLAVVSLVVAAGLLASTLSSAE